AGLTEPDTIIPDGKIHRFASNGKPLKKNGWYVAYADGNPTIIFGDWSTDLKRTWSTKTPQQMTAAERREHQSRIEESIPQREAEELERHEKAQDEGWEIWKRLKPAQADHAYLRNKQIRPYGIRVSPKGELVIPMYDEDDEIWSYQFLRPDGTKRFLKDGRT